MLLSTKSDAKDSRPSGCRTRVLFSIKRSLWAERMRRLVMEVLRGLCGIALLTALAGAIAFALASLGWQAA
jgi:hypothetical protein